MKPKTKPAAKQPRPRKHGTITQQEIRFFLVLYKVVEKQVLAIRRKLRAGAVMEPGELKVRSTNDPLRFKDCNHYSLFGLDITRKESSNA